MRGRALAACPGDTCCPVGFFVIETARGQPAFRNIRPRLCGAGEVGHHAAGRNRDPTALTLLILRHSKVARGFCCSRRSVKGLRGSYAQHAQRCNPGRNEYPDLHRFHPMRDTQHDHARGKHRTILTLTASTVFYRGRDWTTVNRSHLLERVRLKKSGRVLKKPAR